MSKYWIRNRGRTTGPFTAEKLQSLARRGRFNRHFQVSRDKKNWNRATDFPELFAPVQDVVATPQYGNPLGPDDDFVEAPRRQESSAKSKRAVDDYDDDDSDAEVRISRKPQRDDDDWDDDDDDEWDDDDDYERASIGEWLSDHVFEFLVVGGIALLFGFIFYIATRENWTIDESDLATLISVRDQIRTGESSGLAGTNEWNAMRDQTKSSLGDMISRLENTASAQDHIKQELLFTARDDIPKLFDELPAGKNTASQRIDIRLQKIREMLTARIRQYGGTQVVDSGRNPGIDPAAIAKLRDALKNNGNVPTGDGNTLPPDQTQNPGTQPPAESPPGEGGGVGMRRSLPGKTAPDAGQSQQSAGGEGGGSGILKLHGLMAETETVMPGESSVVQPCRRILRVLSA